MSAPITSVPILGFVPLAVLGASLLGSGHCIAMCGGLIASMAPTKADVFRYHLGRLVGYAGLGALAGWLGEGVLRDSHWSVLPWIAALLLGTSLITAGVRAWLGKGMHFSILPRPVLRKLYSKVGRSSLRGGLLSAFLPCGWLHTFVLGAVATRSPLLGGAFLFFFWLGTLPALTVAPLVFQKLFRPLALRAPRFSATLLILAGVFCIGFKLAPVFAAMEHPGSPVELICH